MDSIEVLPDLTLYPLTELSENFINSGAKTLKDAAYFLKNIQYGANTEKNDHLIIFKEKIGNCTTKHAAFAALCSEFQIPVFKTAGIYLLNNEIVTGIDSILKKYCIPYFPYIHCFLTYGKYRIDLTADNCNGKNKIIEDYIYTEIVRHNITPEEENLIYLKRVAEELLNNSAFKKISIDDAVKIIKEIKSLLSEKVICLI